MTATLPDPQLGLYSGTTLIASNTRWGRGRDHLLRRLLGRRLQLEQRDQR